MVKLTSQDVLEMAQLAHLELSPKEAQEHVASFQEILDYMDQLGRLDTSEVQETSGVFPEEYPEGTPQAEDKPRGGLDTTGALQNAPDRQETFFKVPRVIES